MKNSPIKELVGGMETDEAVVLKKFSNYEIFVIVILAFTQFTVVLDFMVMSPLGDLLMKSMDLSTQQFGFSVSAFLNYSL